MRGHDADQPPDQVTEIAGAVIALGSLALSLQRQLRHIQASIDKLQPGTPCCSGLGMFDQTGTWWPSLALQYDVHPWIHFSAVTSTLNADAQVFIVGAIEHVVTHRVPVAQQDSAATGNSIARHAAEFLGNVAIGGHRLLEHLKKRFQLRGAPTLRSCLNVKRVRQSFATTTLATARHIAHAADALRHLAMVDINRTVDEMCTAIDTEPLLEVLPQVVEVPEPTQREIHVCVPVCHRLQWATRRRRGPAPAPVVHFIGDSDDESWSASHDTVDSWAESCATCIQATWRGWALRTFAIDLRGAWDRLSTLYRVLLRGRLVMDRVTGLPKSPLLEEQGSLL